MVHVHVVLLYLLKIEILNAATPQNNVPSESSFATKSALFGPKNVRPFQILDLTLSYCTLMIYHFMSNTRK